MFPEKKVGKNTFRAFTGKLEEPIDWRSGGGDASLEGWLILTSLGQERSASRGYAISLQRRTRRWPENYGEKSPFVFVVDKSASWAVLYGRHDEKGWLPSASVCTKTGRKFLFTPSSPPPRRCSFSHWCQPCLWDETEFLSALQHYCLLASVAQWPPFCQTFRSRLESF